MFGFLKNIIKSPIPTAPQGVLEWPLLQLSQADIFTVGNACEGVHIFGGTGSGKTSGSGKALARELLASGFGGLVLTAKPDEANNWRRLVSQADRDDDLIIFGAGGGYQFNFLDYECGRGGVGGGQTENIVSLFSTIMEVGSRGGGAGSDPYWERAAKQLLRNAVDLCRLARGGIKLTDIAEIIMTAPKSAAEARSEGFISTLCYRLINEIDEKLQKKELTPSQEHDYRQTFNYFIKEFPSIGDKTRSGIVSTFTAMADSFLRGELYSLFCTDTNLTPEDSFDGKIIVVDLSVKQWGELGRYAQVVFKYLWQQAIERRAVYDDTLPAFLWADEAQLFLSKNDQEYMTTARSARAITVFLSQNMPNYVATLGDSERSAVDSLLGNFQTKIFHQNTDTTTNQWAAELMGRSLQSRSSFGSSTGYSGDNSTSGSNFSTSQQMDYEVQPSEFTTLRKGGGENNLLVDAILFQGGRIWDSTERPYMLVTFSQE